MGALAVFAAALVVAGCGSGDGGSGTSSLTKAEFVKQGNAICAEGNKEIEAGFETFAKKHQLSENSPPSKTESKEAGETILIPAISKQLEKIRALGAPSGEEEEVDTLLSRAEKALKEGEEDPAAFIEGELAPFKSVNREARELGLTVCGEEE